MAALMKLGGNLLAPAVKREQDAQFMQGMQRVAQGEAVKEIVDEQPWFSKIFGSTNLVDGARTYTAAAKAGAIATDLDNRMPEIAKMPGQVFASHINDILDKSATGDGATDALVRQQFMSQMPEVMKRQARSHFMYQQEQMVEANRAYVGTAFAGLATADAMSRKPQNVGDNGSLPRSITDDGDVLSAGVKALDVFNVPDGMDPKVHSKILSAEVVQSINNGSFAVFNMLESSGAMGRFEPAQAGAIRAAANALRSQVRAELPVEFAKVLHQAKESARITGATQADIDAKIAEVNKTYERITGDKKPYITADGTSSLYGLLERQTEQDLAEARRLDAARAKLVGEDNDKANEVGRTQQALRDGVPINGVSSEVKRHAWAQLEAIPTEPGKVSIVNQTRVLRFDSDIDENYRDRLRYSTNMAISAGSATYLHEVYTKFYKPLIEAAGSGGSAAALAYAGALGGKLDAYHQSIKLSPNPTQFDIDRSFAALRDFKPGPLSEREKKIAKHVSSMTPTIVAEQFDSFVRNPEEFAKMIGPLTSGVGDIEADIKAARASNPTFNLLGGYHWQRDERQADTAKYFQTKKLVAGNEYHDAFRLGVDTAKKEAGMDEVSKVIQVGDKGNGVPQYQIIGKTPAGELTAYTIAADRIEELWSTRNTKPAKMSTGSGPKLTGVMAPVPNERPSIYATEEEWAAYRKAQSKQ
jgi:hypothetical protein